MSIPVNSNLQSKKCGGVISSNCVQYDGPATGNICKGASMSEALFAVSESANCCEGSFPAGHQSCWTGTWIDFSSSIPTSGFGSGYTYTVGSFGGGIGLNNPQYKWEKNGDLKIRGGFVLTIIPTAAQASFSIALISLPITCFPTGFTAAQFAITTVNPFNTNGQTVNGVSSSGLLLRATGVLTLEGGFLNTSLVTESTIVGLGGTTFNLA